MELKDVTWQRGTLSIQMKKAGNSNYMLLNTGMTKVLFWESMPIKKHSVTRLPKCTRAQVSCANSLSNHKEQTGIQMTQCLLIISPKLGQSRPLTTSGLFVPKSCEPLCKITDHSMVQSLTSLEASCMRTAVPQNTVLSRID